MTADHLSTVLPAQELVAPALWHTVEFISDLHLDPAEPGTLDAWRRYPDRMDSIFDERAEQSLLSSTAPSLPTLSPAEAESWLAALSPDERETIILKIYDDFSFQEIADLRAVPLATASSWYRRGLAKLRTLWIKETR